MLQFKQSLVPLKRQIKELEFIISKTKVQSWQAAQDIVRAGLANKAFNIGDQLLANYNGSPVAWDIIGIDHDMPTDPQFKHSLTLQAHDCILNAQFDASEALFFAETELSAGEQVFTLNNLKYKFTTGLGVPAGGQVFVNSWDGETYVPTKITTYTTDKTTVIESGLVVTPIEMGVDTLFPVNHHQCCKYGSNNYMESVIKQWLNSEASAFAWTPKTNFDRPPSGAPYTGAGFLKLLDPELVAVLGAVDKQVARNTVTDSGGQDLFSDKAFLLSRVEIFGGDEGETTGEKAYPYYSALAVNPTTAALVGRIKYLSGSPRYWWLRSPNPGYATTARRVYLAGEVDHNFASSAYGAAPACCIV